LNSIQEGMQRTGDHWELRYEAAIVGGQAQK